MSYYISEFLYESPIIQDLDVPPEGVNDQQDLSELDRWYGSPTNLGARRGAVERIRNRDPAEVAGNAGRVIAAIEHFYVETSGQSVEELHRKAGDFSLAFERDVFSRIVHCTANDLGDPVELRSPEGLATDAEQDAITLSASSGTRDSIVGNTRYVFASSASLLSQAYGGHSYRITDPDAGYVVPVDLADLSLTPQQADAASGSDGSSPDRGAVHLNMYADNIYTIKDYKKVLALYSAALFETAEKALDYYRRQRATIIAGWDVLVSGVSFNPDAAAVERDRSIGRMMQQLMEVGHVYPPFAPEFQYPDRTIAERVDVSLSHY